MLKIQSTVEVGKLDNGETQYDSGEVIEITKETAKMSKMLNSMIGLLDEGMFSESEEAIPVNVDKVYLPHVVNYMRHHAENPKEYPESFSNADFEDLTEEQNDFNNISAWDLEFFKVFTMEQLNKLFEAVFYMEVSLLIFNIPKVIARIFEEKSVEELTAIMAQSDKPIGQFLNL